MYFKILSGNCSSLLLFYSLIIVFIFQVGKNFLLFIRVWDGGSPPLHSETLVSIKVVEESKHPPTVYPLQVTIFSYQSAFPGGVIGSVTALDNDPYDTLRYRVGNNQNLKNMNYFAMDEIEGTLRVTNPLDEGIYHVNVSVSDGKFARSADAVVSVRILSQEMVDNSFVFSSGASNC